MNKKLKFTSAVLTAGLVLTPLAGVVNNNSNIVHASHTKNVKSVKEIIKIKNSDVLKILKQKLDNKEISKQDYDKIKTEFDNRWGAEGETKIIYFWDGAFDLYLNSYYSYAIAGTSIAGGTALLGAALIAAGASGGASMFVAGAISNVISMIAGTELSRGVIIYFKKAGNSYYPSQVRPQ